MSARWSGRDWSALGTTVSPAAAGLGALLVVVGVLVPLAAPWVAERRRASRAYVRLEPLERALDDLLVRRALRLPRPRFASPATLLMWRRTSIHNALGQLAAYCDGDLYDRTRADALAATGDPGLAGAQAWAAVLTDALRREAGPGRTSPPSPGTGRSPAPSPDPATLARIADVLAGTVRVPAASALPGGRTTAGTA